VPALIAGEAVRTCLGDGDATFARLLGGTCGVGDLRYVDASKLNVTRGYHIDEDGIAEGAPLRPQEEQPFRASRWLQACVREAVAQSGVDPTRQRVVALIGTGLRELRAVELHALDSGGAFTEHLHFASAVLGGAHPVGKVVTLANACSAGGYALALAQDLIELGETDAVVVGGADGMTESMLAMIGRVADGPTERVRPFDADRTGVLLGEGAAVFVLVAEGACRQPRCRLLATGLSCDAYHETAPDEGGIRRAMEDALARAGLTPDAIDLVVAHGTGTALNDLTEVAAIRQVLATNGLGPLITATKGAVGHTSGGSALVSVAVAIRCLRAGLIPPIVGLRSPLDEGAGLRFVSGGPLRAPVRRAQVNAFGFGGINAVTMLEAVA
jgi:3-oxoacyl-[acyl-carrier-protein] synthase II